MQSWSQAPPIKELSKEWKIFVTDKFGTMKIVKLPQWNGIVCLVHVYRLRILQEVVPALHQNVENCRVLVSLMCHSCSQNEYSDLTLPRYLMRGVPSFQPHSKEEVFKRRGKSFYALSYLHQ